MCDAVLVYVLQTRHVLSLITYEMLFGKCGTPIGLYCLVFENLRGVSSTQTTSPQVFERKAAAYFRC